MISKIEAKPSSEGILIKFKKRRYGLQYPKEIWKNYPHKKELIENYVPLVTISLPLILKLKKIHYNLPQSAFHGKFKELMIKDIPSATYDYKKQDAAKLIKHFLDVKFNFEGKSKKIKTNKQIKKPFHEAVIPFSLGKDSLTTLAVSREIGLNPVSVYVNDTVSQKENKLKLESGKRLAKELKQKHFVVMNNIEKLNDFDTWNKPETSFNYSHMITGFCFIALPFVHHFNSDYIILGNQQDMNFTFQDNQYTIYPAFDQHKDWKKEQNKIISKFTGKNIAITSVIEPLTNISIMKVLHKRYPKIAKYQISCDCLNTSGDKRWCNQCNKCARLSLWMTAFGVDKSKLGLRNLFQKKHKKLYSLFNGKEVDRYEKSIQAKEQQLLGFLLAIEHGAKGYLVDYFKRYYLKQALEKEGYLRKKYFKIWPSSLPLKIKQKVHSIYKEELADLR
ncbi:MAG: hypothetical protein JSW08_02170 [archaeon]|nr:MAG: hypothetical protein JSW08_02170 [archaeon]